MSNDFDHIGFQVQSGEEFGRLVRDNIAKGTSLPTPVGGSYVRVDASDGPELWLQVSPSGEPFGGHPHYSGSSRIRLGVTRVCDAAAVGGGPLDGSLLCELQDDQPGVPLLVDIPDFRMHAGWLTPGASVLLQLCAFPREIQVSTSEADHAASRLGKLAPSGALIPSGLFKPAGEPVSAPQNHAILAGRVDSCRDLTNSTTGRSFLGLTVRTLGGLIDVPLALDAAHPRPEPGAIVAGSFTLCGRLIEPKPTAPADVIAAATARPQPGPAPKRPFLRRLFGQ